MLDEIQENLLAQRPNRPRSISEIERDLRVEADLYLRGIPQSKIAEQLGLSVTTISKDISKLHAEWLVDRKEDMTLAKNRELAKVDTLERQYWKGWERSQKTAHAESDAIAGSHSTVSLKAKHEQFGDPRYLNGVMSCINKRCEILGLNAPKNMNLNVSKTTWTQFINNTQPPELGEGVIDVKPEPEYEGYSDPD